MTIDSWNLTRDFVALRAAMNHLFEDSVVRPTLLAGNGRTATYAFPVDLYETADAFVLTAEVPGVRPEQLDITTTSDGVTLKAESTPPTDATEADWHLRERRFGMFTRSFALLTPIDPDTTVATYENGVLVLKLPKAESARPRQIKVGPRDEARSR